MKIKKLSCTQFAGIRDRSVNFSDGINIVCGSNESGKSTLVALLSRTLFQDCRIDGRRDKDFREQYFPAALRNSSIVGDYIDGKVTLQTDKGEYTLSKKWGNKPDCILAAPEANISTQSTIDEIMKEILVYGEGVYMDMLFSSQHNTDKALQTLLDASERTDAKQELTDTVTLAFGQGDGVSTDAIEQAISAKIEEMAGKHWDFESDAPARKSGRWATGLGEVLKAYYALEDARAVVSRLGQLERNAVYAAAEHSERDSAARSAEEEFSRFNTFASRLSIQNEHTKTIDRLERELKKYTDILAAWPQLNDALDRAKALQNEKTQRELLDRYAAAKALADELRELQASADAALCPTQKEISDVKAAQRGITSLENKLCGMNINAAIKLLGGNTAEVRSLLTGEPLDISGENVSITEAVSITVPGVIEMQLSPADVDIADTGNKLSEQQQVIEAIFAKYGVDSLDALEGLAGSIVSARAKVDNAGTRLSMLLGDISFQELELAAKDITAAVRTKDEIDREILIICGGSDIVKFITAKETVIEGYSAEYGSTDGLQKKAYLTDTELKKAREYAAAADDIPPDYLSITDPDSHLEALMRELKLRQEQREAAFAAKTSAESVLQSYRESVSDDPNADAENAERIFTEKKTLLKHWKHIYDVFTEQKQKLKNNPMSDIADKFAEYLGMISGHKVSSEFPEADKLSMNIYSSDHLLDYKKLSEGTRDTVYLAFRLAVLEHLFPEGGGVIVLDDPLTDMDAERTAQSCKLLKKCAERHQVIFLTCREEYIGMLGGNDIRI